MQQSDLAPPPEFGDLVGWVIQFGPKREYVCFVRASEGQTAALLKASHLENAVVTRVVAG